MARTESPIETVMLRAFESVARNRVVIVDDRRAEQLCARALADEFGGHVYVATQVKVGPYRADFMLSSYRSAIYPHMLVVECDGAAYHASANQRQRDVKRDDWMRCRLITTKRFTGKQIMRDPYKCAHEAISIVAGGDYQRGDDGFVPLGCIAFDPAPLAGETFLARRDELAAKATGGAP